MRFALYYLNSEGFLGYCIPVYFPAQEGRKIVKLLPLNNASDITNLMYEQERYAVESEKNKENFSYYAVTRDVSMIAKLKDYDVNLPLRIALIRDEEVDGRPKIQYVSLEQL